MIVISAQPLKNYLAHVTKIVIYLLERKKWKSRYIYMLHIWVCSHETFGFVWYYVFLCCIERTWSMWSHGVLEYIGYIDLLKGSPNGFNVQSSTNILYVVGACCWSNGSGRASFAKFFVNASYYNIIIFIHKTKQVLKWV